MKTIIYTTIIMAVTLFSIDVNAENRVKLSGRMNDIEYDFNENWHNECLYLLNNDNGNIHKIYFFEDDLYYAEGVYYLDNPDRGCFMIPLYAENKDEKLFRQHFKEYKNVATDYECESFDRFINGINYNKPKWGFYKKDNKFYLHYFE